MRFTLSDVAKQAGVSGATVDRVLNNRAGVHPRTRSIVLQTAQKLGYLADPTPLAPVSPALAAGALKLVFALPAGANPFILALKSQIETQARLRPHLDVHVAAIEGFNPDTLAQTLLEYRDRAQGIGVVALDHPAVREAIRTLSAAGVRVVTIVSDILHVPRVAYVGIDNRAAGRLAGYLVRRFFASKGPGKVALFAGSLSYRGHEEREMGFRHSLDEEASNLTIVELREMRDDADRAYFEAASLLDAHPDLAAIYNIGGGVTGIAKALKERGLERRVILIGHEVTEGARELLLDGTIDAIIDQNPRVEAREALNILDKSIQGLPFEIHSPRIQAVFKENIPDV